MNFLSYFVHSTTALLSDLDVAIPVDSAALFGHAPNTGHRSLIGLEPAVALSNLLREYRLGWPDVVRSEFRLAKLCGRLGSDFPGEREAAYVHALRFIVTRRTTWSAIVHFPSTLQSESVRPNAATESSPSPPAAPEGDWLTTVRILKARSPWLSAGEQLLLDAVEGRLFAGRALNRGEAIRLRNMWWKTELHDPKAELPM